MCKDWLRKLKLGIEGEKKKHEGRQGRGMKWTEREKVSRDKKE